MQISSWQQPYYHNLVDLYNGDRIDSFKLSRLATDVNLSSFLNDLVSNFLMQILYILIANSMTEIFNHTGESSQTKQLE